ncbi:hypothetical protein ACFSYG_10995 [Leeuwenhoekiella polynyae]|uniref:Alpha-ketoglutarate decarboxylase n=1 Tax=Leeuwenhoekiella polynyae TaxID=1550906 RepID=A0A4Q0NYI6_9FLAO|nr:hypothetical protein [Leeuwenhoekiella polynyae]RXG16382.1 hypothetical protein DSM02_3245 [Leeuwenhoekiella polynyae]
MKSIATLIITILFVTLFSIESTAQFARSDFWDRVAIGGGLGLNFGQDYFAANISPSAVYNFNPYFAAGPGLSYSYIKNGRYKSSIVGGSIIALANPLPIIQLSAEFEELYVTQIQELDGGNRNRDFWNSALFLGAGYRSGPVTIGARYNVLFKDDNLIYTSAIQPFIRFYF